jgi:hypothetical protein
MGREKREWGGREGKNILDEGEKLEESGGKIQIEVIKDR